jgi:hypothetical protein
MAIFAVVAVQYDDRLRIAVEREYAQRVSVAHGHWLIVSPGTAQEVATKLGTPNGSVGQVIIYNVGGYFGFAPTNIWEWLKSNGSNPVG